MAQPAVIGMSDNYPGFDIDQAQFERFSRDATHGRTEDAKAMAGVSRDETAFELSTKTLAWEKCDKNRALFDQVRYALGVLRAAHSTVLFPSVDRDDEILQVCSSLPKSYITRPPLVPLQSPLSPLLGVRRSAPRLPTVSPQLPSSAPFA